MFFISAVGPWGTVRSAVAADLSCPGSILILNETHNRLSVAPGTHDSLSLISNNAPSPVNYGTLWFCCGSCACFCHFSADMGIMQPCGLCRAARFKGQMCTGWYVTTVGKENCRFTRMGGSCQISLGGKKKTKKCGIPPFKRWDKKETDGHRDGPRVS